MRFYVHLRKSLWRCAWCGHLWYRHIVDPHNRAGLGCTHKDCKCRNDTRNVVDAYGHFVVQ